jgi:hypothetical protein
MKVMVWAVKDEILSGKISRVIPYEMRKNYDHWKWEDYILCSLTVDEYAQLEDKQQYSASIDGPGVPINRKDDQEYSSDNWNKGVEQINAKKKKYYK